MYAPRPAEVRREVRKILPSADIFIGANVWANSRVVVAFDGGRAYVVYRGTKITSPRSIWANTKIRKARWGNGLVHSGFLRIASETLFFIIQAVRRHGGTVREIVFTGHSQGGAVAYLTAMTFLLHSGLRRPHAVYTFGQPRAGDPQFSRDAELRMGAIYGRVVNKRDFFVGTPPVRWGFDHTREFFHFGKDQSVSRKLQACGQGWPGSFGGVMDHFMDNYVYLCACNRHRIV